jgi:hypothetical protein
MDLREELKGTDDAFVSSVTPKDLNGLELKPFSLMRETAAIEIVQSPATEFRDAVVRVWLCTLEPKEVAKAMLDRPQAHIDAFDWADKQGISWKNSSEILALYKRINAEIGQSSNVRQDGKQGNESPNAGGLQAS